MIDAETEPFWKTKTLEQMDPAEWESLCDGCGRCCLVKLQDEDTDAIAYTDIGCKLLDEDGCRCRDYPNRQSIVPDCVRLTPEAVRTLDWLPPSCGYRLVAEGRDLYWWHPLVSGDPDSVHAAGVSVRGRVSALEDELPLEDFVDRMVRWPLRLPKQAMTPRRRR
ncbi:YcgN family cysteine cluster protein [Bosea sp. 117]|uniref:YcgN family cysteine cluster protein n=1 Tax=Bosea sp. 117 TaxID=1125973 RepID=UPI0005716E75|nr:YcgN family cysteine cluster protein [Bosea sp. 117]